MTSTKWRPAPVRLPSSHCEIFGRSPGETPCDARVFVHAFLRTFSEGRSWQYWSISNSFSPYLWEPWATRQQLSMCCPPQLAKASKSHTCFKFSLFYEPQISQERPDTEPKPNNNLAERCFLGAIFYIFTSSQKNNRDFGSQYGPRGGMLHVTFQKIFCPACLGAKMAPMPTREQPAATLCFIAIVFGGLLGLDLK